MAFTGQKIRNYPAHFGQASLAICSRNDDVATMTIRFMQALNYRGALDLGYRYDSRDGRYKVNDINPRIGAMFRCFVGKNGMDVARALYQEMTGQPVTASITPIRRKWIVEDVDLVSAVRYYVDGKFTTRELIDSFRGIDEAAYLARDDLGPFAGICLADAKQILGRLLGSRRRKFDSVITGAPVDAVHR